MNESLVYLKVTSFTVTCLHYQVQVEECLNTEIIPTRPLQWGLIVKVCYRAILWMTLH